MAPKKTEDSATRRTRSQVAPDWTLTQSLILVNEIAAVEADCLDALSYYQKWKIIAENCAALDVNRTLDQCRRKWDSLFADYNIIKRWETAASAANLENVSHSSYWGLGTERKKAIRLPEEFDRDLFNAVDDVVKAQLEKASLDPDTVLEDADADPIGVIAPPVLRKQSNQLTPQKRHIDEETEKETVDDKEASPVEVMATQPAKKAGNVEVMAKPLGNKPSSVEEVATQLREKADMIQAILEGKLAANIDCTLSDLKQGAASRINLARRQGDKLIDCFSVIASTLDQLCKVAHIQ
ncbi:unnamed protein product [Rhodiola kirilowii]